MLVILLIILSAQLYAQEILSYDLDVKIDVNKKCVDVEGSVDVDFNGKDSINLVLWKNTEIKEISSDGKNLKYLFDTLSPTPVMYIINGSSLTIKKPPQNEDKHLKAGQLHSRRIGLRLTFIAAGSPLALKAKAIHRISKYILTIIIL